MTLDTVTLDTVTLDTVRLGTVAKEGTAMRVVVDRDLCEANGVCAGLAPGVFDLDDEDYLHIVAGEVPAASADLVRRAVASCPRLALSLAD